MSKPMRARGNILWPRHCAATSRAPWASTTRPSPDGMRTDSAWGLIAQALFMAELLSEQGEAVDPQLLLDAKGAWSELGLPEDVNNWGRLRQYAIGKEVDKSLNNVGAIMSGRLTSEQAPVVEIQAEELTANGVTTSSTTTEDRGGYGRGGKPGKGGGNGKGKGHWKHLQR